MLEIMKQRYADLMAIEEAKLGRGKREAARKISYKPVLLSALTCTCFVPLTYRSCTQRSTLDTRACAHMCKYCCEKVEGGEARCVQFSSGALS